jgi:AcrR family transcriptional regulator
VTTTPKPTDTRQRILAEALVIANREGVDALAIRHVAKALDLSPGNVSYHFARKVDLVLALSAELSDRNQPLGELVPTSLDALLERYRSVLRHQHEHRGIVVALPHLIETYPEMRRRYRQTERQRFQQQREQIAALMGAGLLTLDDDDLDRLVATIVLVARFWLAEYRTTFARYPVEQVIGHYLGIIAGILAPHASRAGRAQLVPYLAGVVPLPEA